MPRKVGIVSIGYSTFTSIRRETREKSEINYAAIKSALDNVRLSISDIDVSIYTSVDGFEGANRIERLHPCYGQAFNTPVYSVNTGGTGGASAVKEAYDLIAAGIYDLALVFGGCTFGVIVDNQQILNTAMDPLLEKPIGPGAISIAAWYASRYLQEYGWSEEELAHMAAQSHKNAASNPSAHIRKGYSFSEVMASPMISWPIRLYEICPSSSGAACLIIASEDKAREITSAPVWLDVIGSNSDTFVSGYRPYNKFDILENLAKRIYPKAGINDPRKDIDVVEIFNPFSIFELLAYEALGFCERGKAPELVRNGVTAIDGELPVNPSGGTLCTNSGIAASLTRIGEVALQLMGKAEGRQVKNHPRVGMATAWGGSDGQFHTIAILSRD
jgi:acetyl-CoA C-acetyltransferase